MRPGTPSLSAIARGALTALLICAPTVRAQRNERSLDVGAVALRYADTLNASALILTPRAAFDWGRTLTEASGTYSQFAAGGWSAQGSLSGSLFGPNARGLLTELAGFAGGSAHTDGTRTGEVLANVRLHAVRASGELFAGVGAGRTWVGGDAATMVMGEAGASRWIRDAAVRLSFNPVAVDSLGYVDGQLSLALTRDRVDVGAVLGTRMGDQLTALGGTARSWGSLSAVAWMRQRIALVAAGGSYPIDPTQGFPGGRFVSLSVRLATRRSRQSPPPNTQPLQTETASDENLPVVTAFSAQRVGVDSVTLTIGAPRARVVEITADFTGWTPVQLAPAGNGLWATTLRISPGNYQMNLRLDGGKWLVPPGLLSMLDEFGGAVGLLIVGANTKM